MIKYMLDTNAIDKAMASGKANTIGKRNDVQICITAEQAEEICRIPDKKIDGTDGVERRVRLLITLFQLRALMLPTAAVVGHARLGTCILGDSQMDSTLNAINDHMPPKSKGHDNIVDSMIAEAAIREGCILVTEDAGLYNAMKSLNKHVLKWDEFMVQVS